MEELRWERRIRREMRHWRGTDGRHRMRIQEAIMDGVLTKE